MACTASAPQIPETPEGVTEDQAMEQLDTPEVKRAEESSFNFVGKSSIINHEGSFDRYAVTVTRDETDPLNFEKASIEVIVDLTSAKTDSSGVDAHLQREDFFDTANYPQATFNSTSITSTGGDEYTVVGDLTIKGVTKEATFDATITESLLTMHYDVPRRDFGVGNDSYGNKLLDPLVPVDASIVLK